MQRNLATKNRAKRESGLTAVRLKRDPPVYSELSVLCILNFFLSLFFLIKQL